MEDVGYNVMASTSEEQNRFDDIIGKIEDIIVSEEFQALQCNFMEKYYMEFDDTEENKFVYTDIFREYSSIVERYLEVQLKSRIPGFSMEKFSSLLQAHKHEITHDIFEMFSTFTDFLAFKEMFLDYKAEKEGKNVDLMENLVVQSLVPSCVVTST